MAIDKKRFLRGWEQEGRFYLETIKEYFFPKVQVEISKQRHQQDFSSLHWSRGGLETFAVPILLNHDVDEF